MKYIIIIAGLCFLFSIIILQNRNINKLTEKQISLQDTLDQFRIIQMNPNDRYVIDRINLSEALDEPEYPEINDSIFEIHWITIRFGRKVNFIKLECKIDSTFKLTNKYARIKISMEKE